MPDRLLALAVALSSLPVVDPGRFQGKALLEDFSEMAVGSFSGHATCALFKVHANLQC